MGEPTISCVGLLVAPLSTVTIQKTKPRGPAVPLQDSAIPAVV